MATLLKDRSGLTLSNADVALTIATAIENSGGGGGGGDASASNQVSQINLATTGNSTLTSILNAFSGLATSANQTTANTALQLIRDYLNGTANGVLKNGKGDLITATQALLEIQNSTTATSVFKNGGVDLITVQKAIRDILQAVNTNVVLNDPIANQYIRTIIKRGGASFDGTFSGTGSGITIDTQGYNYISAEFINDTLLSQTINFQASNNNIDFFVYGMNGSNSGSVINNTALASGVMAGAEKALSARYIRFIQTSALTNIKYSIYLRS